MKKIVIIKYGELSTKKDNINLFLKTLKKNIEYGLEGLEFQITYDKGRMFIEAHDYETILEKLKLVFGIHEYGIGYIMDGNDLAVIGDNLITLLKDISFETFKVETKRSDKTYPLTSPEISKKIGAVLLKNIANLKVDVHNPDKLIMVEIRKNQTLLYFDFKKGLGGYPVSSLGKGLLMLSGGIDSPVAGYMTMKRGVKIEAIYFESPPHTSEKAKEKVLELASILAKYNSDLKIHIINFTEIQETIYKNIPHEYLITIMRRMMYRISSLVAFNNNCRIIVNGESIGQVASQTLTSIEAINSVIQKPVIRPLACFDKLEIIDIAKKIGTYDISIRPYEDCCTIFVPDHPVINPLKAKCEEYEDLIDYNDMIYRAVKNKETLRISNLNNSYEDLL